MIINIVIIVLLLLLASYARGILVELRHMSKAHDSGIQHLDLCIRGDLDAKGIKKAFSPRP